MSPRWGWELGVGDAVSYKHVAPPALGMGVMEHGWAGLLITDQTDYTDGGKSRTENDLTTK